MNFSDYNKRRVTEAIMNSQEARKAEKEIAIKDNKKTYIPSNNIEVKIGNKIEKIKSKISSFKVKNKQVLRKPNRVTVVENQPVALKDKSRFFKEAWEEEKRQLFFK